jgi:hypothetical protein
LGGVDTGLHDGLQALQVRDLLVRAGRLFGAEALSRAVRSAAKLRQSSVDAAPTARPRAIMAELSR